MTFQKTLKELRAKKRITQKELAKMIGVSTVQLNRYENGTIRPRLPIISKLAEVFDVEYSLLSDSLNPLESDQETLVIERNDPNVQKLLKQMKRDFEKLPFHSKLSFISFATNSLVLDN